MNPAFFRTKSSLFALLLALALNGGVLSAADASATAPVPAVDPAVKIAAALVEERSRAAAAAGDLVVAGQLDNLARGLLDRSIALGDAAQVMIIAGESRAPLPSATPPSPQTRAITNHVAALIDGTPDNGHAPADPAPAHTAPAADAPAPAADAPPPPPAALAAPAPAQTPTETAAQARPVSTPATAAASAHGIRTKVYAVNVDASGRVSTAIIGAGGRNGVLVNDRFVITRGNRTIAQVIVVKVDDAQALSFTTVVPGSMPDPNDEVKEGDSAASWP